MSNSNTEVQMCFLLYKLILGKRLHLKSSANKTFEELKYEMISKFCLEFENRFSRFLSCSGKGLANVMMGLCV